MSRYVQNIKETAFHFSLSLQTHHLKIFFSLLLLIHHLLFFLCAWQLDQWLVARVVSPNQPAPTHVTEVKDSEDDIKLSANVYSTPKRWQMFGCGRIRGSKHLCTHHSVADSYTHKQGCLQKVFKGLVRLGGGYM